MSPPDPAATEALILRVLAGSADPAEVRQLRETCAAHPEILDRLALHTTLDRLLPVALDRHSPRFAAEVLARLEPELSPTAGNAHSQQLDAAVQSRLSQPRRWFRTTAAMALAAASIATFFLTRPNPETSTTAHSPGFEVHWSFDEPTGPTAFNTGSGLSPGIADAHLAGSPSPARIPGKSGTALAFNGQSAFVESSYKGIPGAAARTVAMWIRVPPDLKPTESYALIGWGDSSGSGTAWQLSINPEPNDGPPGRLRAGTGQGAVVGSTDLRDGRWHHIAVVMLGGPDASTATHIRLFVDGNPETTTRQSIREIRTDTHSPKHGIWIGRNLANTHPSPPGARFFRGAIDEIHLTDAALTLAEIRRLMAKN